MDILITGGTGFIGRELCRTLLVHGHTLTVLSRHPEKVSAIEGEPVAAINSLANLSNDTHFEAVINLAGEPIADRRWSARRKKLLWDSRIGITEQLVDFISRAEAKPGVLVSGSAVGYYGDTGDRMLDENSACADDFAHQLCNAWEQAALRAGEVGVRVCLLRTGLVVGPDGGFLQRMLPAFRLGLGGRIGGGRQWMSWIHRSDLVAMIEHLLNTPHLRGPFNGTAPHPVTNAEFTRCLAGILKRPALFPVPAWLLRAVLGEMSVLLLGGQRVMPERFTAEHFPYHFDSLAPALENALSSSNA